MNRRLLGKFNDLVCPDKDHAQWGVKTPCGARVVYRHDKPKGIWRTVIASVPEGVITKEAKEDANTILGLFLFALSFRAKA